MQHSAVTHGNRNVVTIPQGKLCLAEDMGQPVLLPPGCLGIGNVAISPHCEVSRTIVCFLDALVANLLIPFLFPPRSLDDHAIVVGPYTILTVEEG